MVMRQQSLSKAKGSSDVRPGDCHNMAGTRWKNWPHAMPGGTPSLELPWL